MIAYYAKVYLSALAGFLVIDMIWLIIVAREFYRKHCWASFQEDAPGLELVDRWGLENNFMWANDYPHHEGSWPHSAAAIERTMGHLNDKQRARILGLNAAKLYGFDVPAEYAR